VERRSPRLYFDFTGYRQGGGADVGKVFVRRLMSGQGQRGMFCVL
jgi:hypothetical protein